MTGIEQPAGPATATEQPPTPGRPAAPPAAGRARAPWRGRRGIRFALAFVLGGKLALMIQGEMPALAFGSAAKPAAGGAALTATASVGGAVSDGRSAADVKTVGPGGAAVRPDVRALLDAVERRQAELDAREREIASKEERLALYEKDVTAKVASLEEIEKRLSARAKAAGQAVDAAAESLAKIYGTMKPEAAAPILDRLDDPTVLTIFRRMKEKQVGEILPLMTRDRAIALTQALAERE
jgi:flagellar motility protein MotE (MotC chaperone)